MKCPLCNETEAVLIYSNAAVPAFQNRVYENKNDALNTPCFPVELMQCTSCGFAWNHLFHPEVMEYDESYQNEQAHSLAFKKHLSDTLGVVKSIANPGQSVIEIGCGKGVFLSMIRGAGYKVTGYDPAHEGNDPDVVSEYFNKELDVTPGDIVVLRHTLEHVAAPVEFLHAICEANGFTGKILIEVPRFEWIVQRRAFWDIFHEHCNYFTESSIAGLFDECSVVPCFEDQYMWIIADINKLREFTSCKIGCQATVDPNIFSNEVERLKQYVALRPGCLIWGAGAKGIAFANQVDPQGTVLGGIVDISPKKQGRYAAKSGHVILSPDELRDHENADIIIMNENYKDEIQAMCERNPNALLTLGEI